MRLLSVDLLFLLVVDGEKRATYETENYTVKERKKMDKITK